MDQPVERFLISFGSGTFGDSGVLESAAAFSKLRGDGKPAFAAVCGGSFWGRGSNVCQIKVEDFLLNIVLYFIRKKQKTLFFVFRCEAPMNFILMVNWLRKTKEP